MKLKGTALCMVSVVFSAAFTALAGCSIEEHKQSGSTIAHAQPSVIDSVAIPGMEYSRAAGGAVSAKLLSFYDIDDKSVVVYDRESHKATRFGRAGSGPGEYNMVTSTMLTDSTIALLDPGLNRITTYSLSGSLVSTQPTGSGHLRIISLGDTVRFGGSHFRDGEPGIQYALYWEDKNGNNGYMHGFKMPVASSVELWASNPIVSKCGTGKLAVALSDSMFVLVTNESTGEVMRRIEMPMKDSDFEPDDDLTISEELRSWKHWRIVDIVGDKGGCVVMSHVRRRLADSSRVFLRIPSNGADSFWEESAKGITLTGLSGDTLHTIRAGETPLTWIRQLVTK